MAYVQPPCEDCCSCCIDTPLDSDQIHPLMAERVILTFKPRACCGTSIGFTRGDAENLPPGLKKAGITEETWQRWVQDYEENVAPHSNVWCLILLIVLAAIFLVPLICLLCCGNMRNWPFQRAAAAWLNRVNNDLQEKGMLAKWQTSFTQIGRNRIERTILSFALTMAESAELEKEPVLVTPQTERCGCAQCLCPLERERVI